MNFFRMALSVGIGFPHAVCVAALVQMIPYAICCVQGRFHRCQPFQDFLKPSRIVRTWSMNWTKSDSRNESREIPLKELTDEYS